MHTGPRVTWEQSESSSRLETDEPARAAAAYLAWPLAFLELARNGPTRSSLWYRAHLRQALVLGIACSVLLFLALALPLGVVFALGGPAASVTITIYAVALVVDIIVFGAAAALLIRCAMRASRGQLFSVPYVTRFSERIFLRKA